MKRDLAEKIVAIANEEDRPNATRAPEIVEYRGRGMYGELNLHGEFTWGILGIPPEEIASLIIHAPEEFLDEDGTGYYDVHFKCDTFDSEIIVY
jgi:hypothetical protein